MSGNSNKNNERSQWATKYARQQAENPPLKNCEGIMACSFRPFCDSLQYGCLFLASLAILIGVVICAASGGIWIWIWIWINELVFVCHLLTGFYFIVQGLLLGFGALMLKPSLIFSALFFNVLILIFGLATSIIAFLSISPVGAIFVLFQILFLMTVFIHVCLTTSPMLGLAWRLKYRPETLLGDPILVDCNGRTAEGQKVPSEGLLTATA